LYHDHHHRRNNMHLFAACLASAADVQRSMAIASPAISLAIDRTQSAKLFSNCSGFIAEMIRLNGLLRRNAASQLQEVLQPQSLGLTVALDLDPTSSAAQHSGNGHQRIFSSGCSRVRST
jgi:hypothetical protein